MTQDKTVVQWTLDSTETSEKDYAGNKKARQENN